MLSYSINWGHVCLKKKKIKQSTISYLKLFSLRKCCFIPNNLNTFLCVHCKVGTVYTWHISVANLEDKVWTVEYTLQIKLSTVKYRLVKTIPTIYHIQLIILYPFKDTNKEVTTHFRILRYSYSLNSYLASQFPPPATGRFFQNLIFLFIALSFTFFFWNY